MSPERALLTITEAVDGIRRASDRHTVLIGIGGRGGSGKSTLARLLRGSLPESTVVELDDFYLPSDLRQRRRESGTGELGADFDWRRLHDQVLEPLSLGQETQYQRYDWESDTMAEWHDVSPGGIVIVEGIYATRPELRALYDLTIWVDAPRELRLERGLERDGPEARGRWLEEWMPDEDRYVERTRAPDHVDLVVDGSGPIDV